MKFTIIFLSLLSCLDIVFTYPKNPELVPKEFYMRQILQPKPGYIPVYLKADDDAPQVRTITGSLPPILAKKAEPQQQNKKTHEEVSRDGASSAESVKGSSKKGGQDVKVSKKKETKPSQFVKT